MAAIAVLYVPIVRYRILDAVALPNVHKFLDIAWLLTLCAYRYLVLYVHKYVPRCFFHYEKGAHK